MYIPELKGSKGVFFKFDGFPGTRGIRTNEGPVQYPIGKLLAVVNMSQED